MKTKDFGDITDSKNTVYTTYIPLSLPFWVKAITIYRDPSGWTFVLITNSAYLETCLSNG